MTIIKYSERRGCLELGTYLTECISVIPIELCLYIRSAVTDQKRVMEQNAEEIELSSAKRLRSSYFLFNWKEHCKVCGKPATTDARHPNRTLVRTVATLPLHSKVLEQCDKRGDLLKFKHICMAAVI